MQKRNTQSKTQYLAQLALLTAVLLVLKLTPIGTIQITPVLSMTLVIIPVSLGAMLLGPAAGAILGLIFGCLSYYDAMSGIKLPGLLFQVNPIHTAVLCIVTRVLVGFLTGWIFRLVKKIDRSNTVCYFVGGLSANLLNTLLFMGYIVLAFYKSEPVQNIVATLGATSPIMFVVLAVGVQGILEAATGLIIGGGVSKAVAHAMKMD